MSLSVLAFLGLGLALLIAGAELLVRGALRLALRFGITPLVVGLTVVAFGTSAPEMAVSVQAGLAGQAGIAAGNIVGSNTFNVLFILGVAALILPLVVSQQLVRLDVPLMIGASLLFWVMALDGRIGRFDGLLLVAGIVGYTLLAIHRGRREVPAIEAQYAQEFGAANGWLGRLPAQLALIAGGLALLVLGATWLVDGAVAIARMLGVSEGGMRNKFLGTGEPGYRPLRKLAVVLAAVPRHAFQSLPGPATDMQARYLPQMRRTAAGLDAARVMALVREGTP